MPALPPGRFGAVLMANCGAMVSVNCWLAVTPLASCTCTVKVKVPEPLGGPLRTPVAEFKPRPPGNAPPIVDQV